MEERYNVVIEDLYKEISEWEHKHNEAIRYHQERSNEVDVKHSKQIDSLHSERVKME